MSKIGIISDIHGNFPALKAVLTKLESERCENIFCLGDVAGYYSMINECIEAIIDNNIRSLKGNHDSYILGESVCPRSHSVVDCINYQQSVIKTEYVEWIRHLNPLFICEEFIAMHGGLNNPIDEYIKFFDFQKAKQLFPNTKIFLSGHTHIQSIQQEGDMVYCNPGSVGQPRDYNSQAAYAILENGIVTLGRVKYPIDLIAENMKNAGFSDYYYKNLYKGCKIGID